MSSLFLWRLKFLIWFLCILDLLKLGLTKVRLFYWFHKRKQRLVIFMNFILFQLINFWHISFISLLQVSLALILFKNKNGKNETWGEVFVYLLSVMPFLKRATFSLIICHRGCDVCFEMVWSCFQYPSSLQFYVFIYFLILQVFRQVTYIFIYS